ncbi:MAG: DsbE family thiol:disulfide interchange protein [Hellea sp.]|nr:DsbE family thiol:disulfide interchange protein [Hellea sp.]
MNRLRSFLPLILFGLLAIGLAAVLFFNKDDKLPSNLIDEPFPEFILTTLDNPDQTVDQTILEGRVSLVNVFGSWCVACVVEHPVLMKISQQGRVQMVGMNWRDKRAKGRAWLDKHGDPYDIILFDEISELAVGIGVTGAPENYLIDKKGRIRLKHVGVMTPDIWKRDFLPLIELLEGET